MSLASIATKVDDSTATLLAGGAGTCRWAGCGAGFVHAGLGEPAQAWVGQATCSTSSRGIFIEHGCDINASLSAASISPFVPVCGPSRYQLIVARAPSRARTRGHVSVRDVPELVGERVSPLSDLCGFLALCLYRIKHGSLLTMLPEDNPYTPNAGAEPRYLAGRESELESFRVLLRRLKKGYTDQSMIVVGLRGVGKTVLLSAFQNIAEEEGDLVAVEAEITKHEDFGHRMGGLVRRALFTVAPSARWKDRGRRAAAVLRSFQITLTPQGELTAGLAGV